MEAGIHITADSLLDEGLAAAKAGERDRARQCFARAVHASPRQDLAWLCLASVTESLQMRLSYLHRVIELNPGDMKAVEWLASTKKQFAEELVVRGLAAVKSGNSWDATHCLLHAAELDPSNETAWMGLAQLEDPPEDRGLLLERVLAINPGNGRALVLLDEIRGAIELAEQSTDTPESPEAAVAALFLTPQLRLVRPEDSADAEFCPPASEDASEPQFEETPQAVALEPDPESASVETPIAQPTEVHEDALVLEPVPAAFSSEPPDSLLPESSILPVEPDAPVELAATGPSDEVGSPESAVSEPEVVVPEPEFRLRLVVPTPTPMQEVKASVQPAAVADEPLTALSQCPICDKSLVGEAAERCEGCGALLRLELFLDKTAHSSGREIDRRQTLLAAAHYSRAVTKEPEDARTHYKLGLAYLNLQHPVAALKSLRRVSELSPEAGLAGVVEQLAELAQHPQPESVQVAPRAQPAALQELGTILVIDDSATVRKVVAHTLEKRGYRVISAVDGQDGLEKLRYVHPDVVFLDIMMPKLDGYQVCKAIRERNRHLPVIMLSGKDGFFDKMRGKMAGSTAYITKPFDAQTLVDTVRKHIKAAA